MTPSPAIISCDNEKSATHKSNHTCSVSYRVKFCLSADLFVQNRFPLRMVIDELSWSQYLGLDADPVQKKKT